MAFAAESSDDRIPACAGAVGEGPAAPSQLPRAAYELTSAALQRVTGVVSGGVPFSERVRLRVDCLKVAHSRQVPVHHRIAAPIR